MKDRKNKMHLFYTFNSVDRKVKIIQKRWKGKSEVNKARIEFLKSYWNNQANSIHDNFEFKENRSALDKKI